MAWRDDLFGKGVTSTLRAVGTSGPLQIGAFLYGLGLLITNAYLAEFGISDFSSLKVQYVFTGTLFLAFLLFPLVPVVAGVLVYRLAYMNRMPSWLGWSAAGAAVILASAGASHILGALVDRRSYLKSQTPELAQLFGISLPQFPSLWRIYFLGDTLVGGWPEHDWGTVASLLGLYVSIWVLWRRRDPDRADWLRIVAVLSAAFCFYFATARYVYAKHKHFAASFGGGSYGFLDLWLTKDGAAPLRALCAPLVRRKGLEGAPLVYETHEAYVVLRPPYDWSLGATPALDDFATFVIPKKNVAAARWVANANLENPPTGFVARPGRCRAP